MAGISMAFSELGMLCRDVSNFAEEHRQNTYEERGGEAILCDITMGVEVTRRVGPRDCVEVSGKIEKQSLRLRRLTRLVSMDNAG